MATDVGAMFDRALAEPRLSHLGESLETARRLYGVGNYIYCRDLVGYLLQQHPDVADTGVLRGIYDELEGLAVAPDEETPPPEAPPPEDDDDLELDDDDGETTDEFDIPRRGAKVVHTLGTGVRVSPRSRPSGHFGGAAARDATPSPEPAPEPEEETPVVRAIDPRPAPTPPPRRTPTPPEPSVEVEGRPVLPEWRPPPSPPRRELPAIASPSPLPAAPAPAPRTEVVRYDERPQPVALIEGAPTRVALAFGVGLLMGALAVVLLMEAYRAEMRPQGAPISSRPVIIRTEVPVFVPTPMPQPAPAPAALEPVGTADAGEPAGLAAGTVASAEPPAAASPPAPAATPPVARPPVAAPAGKAVAAGAAAKVAAKAPARPKAPATKPRPKSRAAAKAKPTPTTAGRIVVETRPASRGKVKVKIDGKDRGTAPLRLKIDPGVHEIQTLQAAGYPELRMVRVEPGGLARVVVPLAK